MIHLFFLFALANANCADYVSARRVFLSHDFTIENGLVRAALFDVDETLRTSRRQPGGFTNTVGDIEILPGVAERLRTLNHEGYLVAAVSNQAGIPKIHSLAEIDEVLRATFSELGVLGARVDYYDFAEFYDRNRKPAPGMFEVLEQNLRAQFQARIDKAHSFMVGDMAYARGERRPDGREGMDRGNSDRLFAEAIGIQFFAAPDYFKSR